MRHPESRLTNENSVQDVLRLQAYLLGIYRLDLDRSSANAVRLRISSAAPPPRVEWVDEQTRLQSCREQLPGAIVSEACHP